MDYEQGYYQQGLTDKHPSLHLVAICVMAGIALAVFVSACVGASMLASGTPPAKVFEIVWPLAALLLLACPSGLSAGALVKYYSRVAAAVLPQDERVAVPAPAPQVVSPAPVAPGRDVVAATGILATLKYRDGVEPSRQLVCEQYEWVTQPLWNSARQVLVEMELVDGRAWAALEWSNVQQLLRRLRVEGDKIWCPHRRGMNVLTVDVHSQSGSYIADRPTLA